MVDDAYRKPERSFAHSLALAGVVVASGAAVMVYEFVAVRVLQRFFGGYVDVWASEIAVCLGGLALGYALGGIIADKWRSWVPLGICIACAGVTGLFMERIAVSVGEVFLANETPRKWEPLVAAALSSFLPILALGTILPQAVRLHVRRLERIGTGAGWVAALSTVGSIVGVLLTAYVLLVHFGVRAIINGLSVVLMTFGGVVLLGAIIVRKRIAAALLLFALASTAHDEILFERYTAYHHMIVEDVGGVRLLRFDDEVQSIMSVQDPQGGGFEYTQFFHVPMVFDPTMQSVLFIGLGGGTGPKAYLRHHPAVQVRVAEIDPEVVRVAKRYFHLPKSPRLNVLTSDGRMLLQRSRGQFGAVIMDAYASGPYGAYLPYHMTTLEFFQLVWERLQNGGSLVYNVLGTYGGSGGPLLVDIHTTMAAVFQAVYIFEARSSENTVLVGVKIDRDRLTPEDLEGERAWPLGPWWAHPAAPEKLAEITAALHDNRVVSVPRLAGRMLQLSRGHYVQPAGRILTDDFAPVDVTPQRGR